MKESITRGVLTSEAADDLGADRASVSGVGCPEGRNIGDGIGAPPAPTTAPHHHLCEARLSSVTARRLACATTAALSASRGGVPVKGVHREDEGCCAARVAG